MTYIGTVSDRYTVTLPPDADLPPGTKVEVRPVESGMAPNSGGQWLLRFAGVITDLPPDFAAQHDHYIHGTARR